MMGNVDNLKFMHYNFQKMDDRRDYIILKSSLVRCMSDICSTGVAYHH